MHSQILRALRNLKPKQLLDRHAVDPVIRHGTQVVDAIRERNHLLVELRLACLLNPGVEIADIR